MQQYTIFLIEKLLQDKVAKIDISIKDYENYLEILNILNTHYTEYNIYPQGSLRTGSIIKNMHDESEVYDIDIILQTKNPHKYNRKVNKYAKKLRIKTDPKKYNYYFNNVNVEEKKPCWNIKIGNISIDVTPAILDKESAKIAHDEYSIVITRTEDFTSYEWKDSNPIGYYRWFKKNNNELYDKALQNHNINSKKLKALIRTDLQKSIQILKYLRNNFFKTREDKDYKPASIVITTLVTTIYEHMNMKDKENINMYYLIDAFIEVSKIIIEYRDIPINIKRLEKSKYIDTLNVLLSSENEWQLLNPADKEENFMDRWNEVKDGKKREKAFFDWINYLDKHFYDYNKLYRELNHNLKEIYVKKEKPYGFR